MPNISIPRNTKSATLAWGTTFVAGISASPGTYMIDAPTVADLNTLIADFNTAFLAGGVTNRFANDPASYTKPARSTLSDAAQQFVALASQIAVQIQANNAISDDDKLAIGVQPRNFSRTPVPPPSSVPVLAVVLAINGAHQIEFADINTPASRRKPFGVSQLVLVSHIHMAADPPLFSAAKLVGNFTKSPMIVTHDNADNGKVATYWGQWITRKGQAGGFSAAASATIMFSS